MSSSLCAHTYTHVCTDVGIHMCALHTVTQAEGGMEECGMVGGGQEKAKGECGGREVDMGQVVMTCSQMILHAARLAG